MRYFLPLSSLILVIAGLFSSCEQVIDLDLRDSDARLVVEAQVTDEPGSCKVQLTRVVNYDATNEPNYVTGAVVTMNDNGTLVALQEVSPGKYAAPDLTGIPGHTYQLNVLVDGENYTATSTMPAHIPIDSIYTRFETFFVDTNLVTYFNYQDPAGLKNYYRAIFAVGDSLAKDIFVDEDTFYDGQEVEQSIFSFNFEPVSGDTIHIELRSIDANTYKYFLTLSEILGGQSGQLAAPANPTNNISNGALGFFSAHAVSRANVIVD